jgi:hypothetical protein
MSLRAYTMIWRQVVNDVQSFASQIAHGSRGKGGIYMMLGESLTYHFVLFCLKS